MIPLLSTYSEKSLTPVLAKAQSEVIVPINEGYATHITKQKKWFVLNVDGADVFRSIKHSDIIDVLINMPETI